MYQAWFKKLLKNVLRKPNELKKISLVTSLSLINLTLIAVLGFALMLISDRLEFFIITLIMTLCSGGMMALTLFKLISNSLQVNNQNTESKAFRASPTSLIIFDPEEEFQNLNNTAKEKCWWAKNLHTLQSAINGQESKNAFTNLLESAQNKKGCKEILSLKNNDQLEWWQIIVKPFKDKLLWQCRNVTSEFKERLHLESEYAFLSNFVQNSPQGLFSINENGIIEVCNQKFAEWLDYSPTELCGEPFLKILSKPGRHYLNQPIKLAELNGKCNFLTSASRTKTAYIEQSIINRDKGFFTFSTVHMENLFHSGNEISKLLEVTPLPVVFIDENGLIQDANYPFREKFWTSLESPRETNFIDLIIPEKHDEFKKYSREALEGKDLQPPLELHFKDERESIVSAYLARVDKSEHHPGGIFIQFHDITEQKRIESQLVQSQKMQAVGQLAGGIAHDFNNLLTAMIGFCDLLLQRHSPGDPSFTDIMQIKQNTNRAANLVRQLLAFSRQQTLQPKVLDITECLSELSALLRRLIGSNIDLKFKHSRDLGLVLVDQGQFEQVIINMAVNARDAMENGGVITVSTLNCELKKSKRQGHDIIPAGSYVLVEISDTGAGIFPEHLDRIFDPFFSTKEVGSGTGLGLSTVYGIVKQTGGFIHVNSKIKTGTTFSIYLPRYFASEQKIPKPLRKELLPSKDLTGSSTILLVEDEDAVRLFSARALRGKGYKVIQATNGSEALDLMKEEDEKVDLIISDVVMPQMDGPTFINEIHKFKNDIKVLFISGYAEDTFRKRINDEKNIQFLAKPFNLSDLASRVKAILEMEISENRLAS